MGDGNCTMTDSCGGTYFLQNDNADKLTTSKENQITYMPCFRSKCK